MRAVKRLEQAACRFTLGLAVLISATGVAGVVAHSAGSSRLPNPPSGVPISVSAFLASYVDGSGRVVRWDQGGDTVSEGQAYALLLAVAAGDRDRFAAVWAWTKEHLQRPDGLLAWHWAGGRVVDWMPAADADLDTAWALGLAGTRFGDPSLEAAARRMANSILREETVTTALGPVLVAGPWARTNPAMVEPGYFAPEAFAELERSTGDIRWASVSATAMVVLGRLTGSGLPPDWASVTTAGAVVPTHAPGSFSTPSFGLDAARAVVWAAPCDGMGSAIAARAWARLAPSATRELFPLELSLDGSAETPDVSAVIAVADAAAAQASGRASQASELLDAAARISARYPTYYGSAWVALANSLLGAKGLSDCSR